MELNAGTLNTDQPLELSLIEELQKLSPSPNFWADYEDISRRIIDLSEKIEKGDGPKFRLLQVYIAARKELDSAPSVAMTMAYMKLLGIWIGAGCLHS